jgi:hypothetical protein
MRQLTDDPQPKGSPASGSQRPAALANAECMRKHGVANFPDPTFLSSGGTSVNLTGLTSVAGVQTGTSRVPLAPA